MVLRLKARESRSPPGLPTQPHTHHTITPTTAGWSSPVARQAHNLKVIGSNPIPATKIPQTHIHDPPQPAGSRRGPFGVEGQRVRPLLPGNRETYLSAIFL